METLMATSLCIGVMGALFLPNEYTRMTAAVVSRTMNCWPLRDGQAVALFVESMAVHGEAGPLDKSVQWYAGTNQRQMPSALKLSKDASSLAFDPLGDRMFVAFNNGMLKEFLMADAEPSAAVLGHVAGLTEVLCAPNGKSLLTTGDRGLELWDVQPHGRTLAKTSRLLATGKIDCLAISPCSHAVIAGITSAEGSRLVQIDLRYRSAAPLSERIERLSRLLISPNGKQLAAIHETGEISWFQRASYQSSWQLVDFPGLRTVIKLLASFSPDSRLFITCERFGPTLLVWDLQTKTVQQSVDSSTGLLHGCAFLDASHVLTWGLNRNLTDDSLFPQDDVQVIEL